MKTQYLIIFIALLFCGKATHAQGITYEKNFGGLAGAEFQNDIKEVRDGGYLVTGSTSNSKNGNYDAYCIKLNEAGELLWSKTYGTSLSEADTKCWGTTDSGFVLLFSSHYPQREKDSGVFVVKCNKAGHVQWSKFIKSFKTVTITPKFIYQSSEGDYYVLCDWYNNFFYQANFTIFKLDATGNLVWKKSVDAQPALSSFNSSKIFESDKGDILVIGADEGDNYNSYGSNTALFLFSKTSGTIKSAKKINPDNYANSYLIIFNLYVADNKLNITGQYSKDGFHYKVCWFSIKSDDTLVKSKYIADNNFHSYQYLINKKIIKQPEGGFNPLLLFTKDGGYLYSYSSDHNGIWVNKYDSLGRICPQFIIPVIDTIVHQTTFYISNKSYSLINDFLTTTDNLVTVTDVTAERTTCEGTAPSLTDKIENSSSIAIDKVSETKLQLYPNPAANFVNIRFEVSKAATIQFNIINTEGKTVLTKQLFAAFGKQQTTLNIQSLPPGAYYIKIIGLNKPTAMQFLKIR